MRLLPQLSDMEIGRTEPQPGDERIADLVKTCFDFEGLETQLGGYLGERR